MRTCARSGCNSPAAAILTYDREAQTAYLYRVEDLATRSPGDLCERHVDRLVLPRSWQLDDRRGTVGATTPSAKPRAEKLRAIPSGSPRARATAARPPTRRKWSEVGPSLFDTAASKPAEPRLSEPVTEPVWMPRFGPDSDLDGVLDAKTPLLRRAFGGAGS